MTKLEITLLIIRDAILLTVLALSICSNHKGDRK